MCVSRRELSNEKSLEGCIPLEGGECDTKSVFPRDSDFETDTNQEISMSNAYSQVCRIPLHCWFLIHSRSDALWPANTENQWLSAPSDVAVPQLRVFLPLGPLSGLMTGQSDRQTVRYMSGTYSMSERTVRRTTATPLSRAQASSAALPPRRHAPHPPRRLVAHAR